MKFVILASVLVVTLLQKAAWALRAGHGDVDQVAPPAPAPKETAAVATLNEESGSEDRDLQVACDATCHSVIQTTSMIKAWGCEPDYNKVKSYYEFYSYNSDRCISGCCGSLSSCCARRPSPPPPRPTRPSRPAPRPPTRPTSSATTCSYCYSTIWTTSRAQSRKCLANPSKMALYAYWYQTTCSYGCCSSNINSCCL